MSSEVPRQNGVQLVPSSHAASNSQWGSLLLQALLTQCLTDALDLYVIAAFTLSLDVWSHNLRWQDWHVSPTQQLLLVGSTKSDSVQQERTSSYN